MCVYNLTNRSNIRHHSSEGCIGFWLELWGALPDAFNLSIRTPGGENIPELRLGLQQSVTYSFIYEKSRVTIDSALVEENSGEELILVRIQDPTPGIWTFHMALAQQARAHCTIRQAVFAPQERIPVQQALGRICAMPTVSCPPAIPIAVSGEEITPAALELMQRYGVTEVSVLRR